MMRASVSSVSRTMPSKSVPSDFAGSEAGRGCLIWTRTRSAFARRTRAAQQNEGRPTRKLAQ